MEDDITNLDGIRQKFSSRLRAWIPAPVKIKSIQRQVLMWYIDEPAWAFVGTPGEHERLVNMLARTGVIVETLKDHNKLSINITLHIRP
jgi:hypothetical protein